ncbi:threonine/homoserine efflux transporter RhtA [Advenella incenata]|jgi:drug/metabolite transporter (DMT)-like permease|uniref:Threonine/homoserine efflux transporter RhtA n=1 Tax=Advenella incenata TaxID=267800 RepID=A0A4Q7VBS1_9BURK|nr:DMT family transporter [Advenella incenata]RZT92158.1 threonine/homoserine efflux transporter RhtA [Advenella incenata]
MNQPTLPISSPLPGILSLLVAMSVLSMLDATGKWLMSVGVPLLILCWVRYSVHLILVASIIIPARGWQILKTKKPVEQLLRGVFMLTSTMVFFTTLRYLPQAQATAINFIAPLILLAVAPWILKEKAMLSRWIAAIVGFLGILIVIRPSGGLDPTGVFFGLSNAVIFSMQFIANRRLAGDNPFTTLIWSGLFGTVVLTIYTLFTIDEVLQVLAVLDLKQWLLLLSTGITGGLGHLLQIQAYRQAPASLLSPFVYLQIISATALGWLIWNQFPDGITWLGIAVICASGIGITLYELRARPVPIAA